MVALDAQLDEIKDPPGNIGHGKDRCSLRELRARAFWGARTWSWHGPAHTAHQEETEAWLRAPPRARQRPLWAVTHGPRRPLPPRCTRGNTWFRSARTCQRCSAHGARNKNSARSALIRRRPTRQGRIPNEDPIPNEGNIYYLKISFFYIFPYLGPPPPSGVTHIIFCDGSLISQVLQ